MRGFRKCVDTNELWLRSDNAGDGDGAVYSCPDLVTGAHRYCPNPGKPAVKCDIKSEPWQENVVKIGQVSTPPYTDTAPLTPHQ